jgi:hypothetical protein
MLCSASILLWLELRATEQVVYPKQQFHLDLAFM